MLSRFKKGPGAGRVVRLVLVGVILIAVTGCNPSLTIRYPQFPSGNEGIRLKNTLQNKKRVGVVATELAPGMVNTLRRESMSTEWSQTVLATMRAALEDYGYYTLVDITSRKQRYDELARSQTGITGAQLALGQELQVDHLFYVTMTAIPRYECKVEMVLDKFAAASAAMDALMAAKNKRSPSSNQPVSKPTGVVYLTVFLEARLVNVETGAVTAYANSQPYRAENQSGNLECPSLLGTFDSAMQFAATKIANRLSPKMVEKDVVLEDSVDEVKGSDKEKKVIQAYIKDGFEWAKAGDLTQAEKSFQQAVDESGGSSASALWNLAVLKFAEGQMDDAERLFQRAMSAGGPKWNSSGKREVYALFQKEKKRMLEEK